MGHLVTQTDTSRYLSQKHSVISCALGGLPKTLPDWGFRKEGRMGGEPGTACAEQCSTVGAVGHQKGSNYGPSFQEVSTELNAKRITPLIHANGQA